MNRLLTIAAAAAAVTFFSNVSPDLANAGEVLDRVLTTKTLTVAVGTDWGTMAHLNASHEFEGFDVDVANGIAKRLGVEVKFVTPGWDIIVGGQWQGRWDIAMGQMTPTKVRAEKLDLVNYFYSRSIAVVHKDSKASKLSDLDGKVVGATAGSVDEKYANHSLSAEWIGATPIEYQFTPAKVTSYPDANVMMQDLRFGDGVRLDGIVMSQEGFPKMVASGYPFRQLGEPVFASPAAIAVSKNDREFTAKVADAIKSMKDDGTLSELSKKWYDDIDYTSEK